MKKTKRKFFKLQNLAIIGLLAMIGFTSCNKEEECKCVQQYENDRMYGAPRPPLPCTC